jgi:hypothetical protein
LTALLSSKGHPNAPLDDPGVLEAIRSFVGVQTSTLPVAISWSGISPTTDQDGRPIGPAVVGFGPGFAERPQTMGRHHFTFDVIVQAVDWKSIDGLRLDAGDIAYKKQFAVSGVARPGTALNVWESSLTLKGRTIAAGASVGLSDHLDLSIVVPFTELTVEGQSAYLTSSNIVATPLQIDGAPSLVSGRSSGLGDISVRLKQSIYRTNDAQFAVGVDAHVPTGDAEALLGTGHASVKGLLIAAMTNHALTPHANVGYMWAGTGIRLSAPTLPEGKTHAIRFGPLPDTYLRPDRYETIFANIDVSQSDELDYTFGADYSLVRDARTWGPVSVDFIGRSLRDSAHLTNVPFVSPVVEDGTGNASISQPFLTPGMLNLMLASAGIKVQLPHRFLLSGAVLLPISHEGLRPGITPVIGVEKIIR